METLKPFRIMLKYSPHITVVLLSVLVVVNSSEIKNIKHKREQYVSKLWSGIKEMMGVVFNDEFFGSPGVSEKSERLLRKVEEVRVNTEYLTPESGDKRAGKAWGLLLGGAGRLRVTEGRRVLSELAAEGQSEGHAGLGLLEAAGVGSWRSQPKALVHLTLAALGGSRLAQVALGYRHWSGLAVMSDCEAALGYYREVARWVYLTRATVSPLHSSKLSLLDLDERHDLEDLHLRRESKEFFEMKADQGDVQAQLTLGLHYYYGNVGLKPDVKKALKYFSMAEGRNLDAEAFVGKIFLEGGEDIPQDHEAAFIRFWKTAQGGNSIGEAGLGLMFLKGIFVNRNYTKAINYLMKSASKKWLDAYMTLGAMFFNGEGVEKDYDLARAYFLQGTKWGHLSAYYHLGLMYENGLGVMQSCFLAVGLYKIVTERGPWEGLFLESYHMYQKGRYDEALIINEILGELGDVVGLVNAAYLIETRPVNLPFLRNYPADVERRHVLRGEALLYWRRAARLGSHTAQNKLGDYNYYGLGTEVDYELAATYYRQAAESMRHPEALYNLGYMYEVGNGVAQSTEEARRCYQRAAEANGEAWLPASLALAKLSALHHLQYSGALRLLNVLAENWDIPLILGLLILLVDIKVNRRFQYRTY